MVKDVTISVNESETVCTATPVTLTSKEGGVGGDHVRWVNNTGDRVIVFFPHDDAFAILGVDQEHFQEEIKKGRKHRNIGGAAHKGTYRYAIWSDKTGSFAKGGSDPKIIIN